MKDTEQCLVYLLTIIIIIIEEGLIEIKMHLAGALAEFEKVKDEYSWSCE